MLRKRKERTNKRPAPSVISAAAVLLLLLVGFVLGGCGSSAGNASSAGMKSSSAGTSGPAKTSASFNASSSADTSSAQSAAKNSGASNGPASASHRASLGGSMRVTNQYGTSAAGGSSSAAKGRPSASDSASSSASAGGNWASSASMANTDAYNRKVVYNANLTMQVKDYAQSQSRIRDMVQLAGGYILNFSDQDTKYERGGNYTLKIPADGFFSFVGELKKMNPVKLEQKLQGQDVTSEYVDLNARLQAKQVEEERLMSFMKKAVKSDDLLKFSNQITQVEQELDQIKGRIRYLNENVAYSTVQLRLYQSLEKQPVAPKDKKIAPFGEQMNDALKNSSAGMLKILEGLLLFLAYALPVLLFLAILVSPLLVYFFKKWRRVQNSTPVHDPAVIERDDS